MSSDPASYIATRAGTGRRIALTLRGPLHEYPTSFDLSRDEALKLLSGLSQALFATASHDPRPADPAIDLVPRPDKDLTDNDEIDAIVGALAALTDRVSALEEDDADNRLTQFEDRADDLDARIKTGRARADQIDGRLDRLEAQGRSACANLKTGKKRLDDIEERISALIERVDGFGSRLGRLDFRTATTNARLNRLEAHVTHSAVTPAPERGSNSVLEEHS